MVQTSRIATRRSEVIVIGVDVVRTVGSVVVIIGRSGSVVVSIVACRGHDQVQQLDPRQDVVAVVTFHCYC